MRFLIVALTALFVTNAVAQTPVTTGNEFVTQQPGKAAPGVANMCVDVDGYAKPCGGAGAPVNVITSSSASSSVGVPPNSSTAAEGFRVLKASAGNLYGVELTTGASAGYMMIFDSATVPADGPATPKYCKAVAAASTIELGWNGGPPSAFANGIVVVFSTGANCFTKTLSATAFISGMAK